MPMRQDCKFFESRTYRNGETVRKCDLDLAPEAPWRCPDDCPAYKPRLADVNWSTARSSRRPADEPASLGERRLIAALLDEAEDIVNAAGPSILAKSRPSGPPPRSSAASSAASGAPADAPRSLAAGLAEFPLRRRLIPDDDRLDDAPHDDVRRPARPAASPIDALARGPRRVAGTPLPTTEAEVWRYSRVDELDLDRFDAGASSPSRRSSRPRPRQRAATPPRGRGRRRSASTELAAPTAPGVIVGRLVDRPDAAAIARPVLATPTDVFADAQRRVRARPVVVAVAARRRGRATRSSSSHVARPVAARPRSPASSCGRREQRGCTCVDSTRSADGRTASSCPSSSSTSRRPPASATCTVAAPRRRRPGRSPPRSPTSGRRAHARRHRRPPSAATTPGCAPTAGSTGAGATGDSLAVYFGEATRCSTSAPSRTTRRPTPRVNLLFKGAVGGHVPLGLHRADPGRPEDARGTNAFQTNRNLKLSDDAWAESVPEPRDREQRRALQPRLGGRSDRRGPALLPREPRRAARGGRAPRSSPASSRRCSSACPVAAVAQASGPPRDRLDRRRSSRARRTAP